MDICRLSPREHEVLLLVAAGATTGGIAHRLGVAPCTVDAFVGAAMIKLGAQTRLQAAVVVAIAQGPSAPAPSPALSPIDRELLDLLAAGETVTRAAHVTGMGRRTAVRRLAVLRAAAGVETAAELVVLVARAGLRAGDQGRSDRCMAFR